VWTLLVVFLLAGTPLGAADRSVLRVGMDTRSRPWAFVPGFDYSKEDWAKAPTVTAAQLKRIEGIDIDVMKALAARMNRVPEIVPWPWDGIEDGLLSKRFDVVINAWAPNDRTPPAIVASSPYYEWGLLIAVRSDDGTIRTYKDLAGRRVGHFKNRIVDLSVASLRAGTLVPVDDSDKLFDQLAAGAVDAVVEDSTYVRWRIATGGQFRAVGERLNRLGYHVALRREDRALYESVQAAIRDLTASGEIDRIRRRWESPQQ
jgi:polar amino acid transport system substrate-binding protein